MKRFVSNESQINYVHFLKIFIKLKFICFEETSKSIQKCLFFKKPTFMKKKNNLKTLLNVAAIENMR